MAQRQRRLPYKGRVRHADHKTIVLPVWHWVAQNTEFQAAGMRHVAFLD